MLPVSMRWMGLGIALALLLAPPTLATTADLGGSVLLTDVLVVAEGDTLRLAPGTRLHGPGQVEVHGRLEALGTPDAPIDLRVPIRLLGENESRIEHARLHGVPGTALTQRAGTLRLIDTEVEGNRLGVLVGGPGARLVATNVTLASHTSAGLRISGVAEVVLVNGTVRANAIGIDAALDVGAPAGLTVEASRFVDNAEHVRVDFGDASGPLALARLSRSTFDNGTISARSAPVDGAPDAAHLVQLEENTLRGADVAVRLENSRFAFESRNDTFEGNRIAITAADTPVRLHGTRFDSFERDLALSREAPEIAEGVTYTSTVAPARGAIGPALVGGALVLLGLAVMLQRRRSRALAPTTPPPAGAPDPAPEPTPAPAPAFTALELRILCDVQAYPGSAQAAIAQRLGLSRQALHYHVKKLAAAGHLVKEAKGRTTECRLAPGLLLPPEGTEMASRQGRAEKE